MNNKLLNWLYIIGSILVVGVVAYLAIQLLIVLIPILILIYVFFRIKNYFTMKKYNKSQTKGYTEKYELNHDKDFTVDNEISEIIDVEYEDIKNK